MAKLKKKFGGAQMGKKVYRRHYANQELF